MVDIPLDKRQESHRWVACLRHVLQCAFQSSYRFLGCYCHRNLSLSPQHFWFLHYIERLFRIPYSRYQRSFASFLKPHLLRLKSPVPVPSVARLAVIAQRMRLGGCLGHALISSLWILRSNWAISSRCSSNISQISSKSCFPLISLSTSKVASKPHRRTRRPCAPVKANNRNCQ